MNEIDLYRPAEACDWGHAEHQPAGEPSGKLHRQSFCGPLQADPSLLLMLCLRVALANS